MLRCWNESPDNRPTFALLSKEFEDLLQSNANYLDLGHGMVENSSYLHPNSNITSSNNVLAEMVSIYGLARTISQSTLSSESNAYFFILLFH